MMQKFLKKYGFYTAIASVSLAAFVFMVFLAGEKSLWYDDIYQIYFSWNRSFIDTLKIVMQVDLNPPLWAVISFLWLKVAPYGTVWLKLPAIIFVTMSIFTVGLAGKELCNKKTGIICSFLFALSPLVTLECAYTFRAYGLYLFASVFILYAYIRKLKAPSVKNRILFAFAIFLIAFTHYFGALLCVFLGASDLFLAIKKKQPKNFFIEYVSVASLELFWFIPQLATIGTALKSFWPARPTVLSYFKSFKYLLYNSYVMSALLLIVLAYFVYCAVKAIMQKKYSCFLDEQNYFKIILFVIPSLFLLIIFIYSNIKPESSVWVQRYFFSLYPMLIVLVSMGCVEILEKFFSKNRKSKIVSVISLVIISAFFIFNYSTTVYKTVNTEYEPFENVAEEIMAQPEIKSGEKVLIINTTNCGAGWNYYLSKDNSVKMNNIHTMDLLNYSSRTILSYDVIYLYAVHFDGSFSIDDIREEITQTHREEILDHDRNVYKYVRIK